MKREEWHCLLLAAVLVQSLCTTAGERIDWQAHRQLIQVEPGSEGEEGWSYPYMALRDPIKHIVRIYGQYSVKVIGNMTHLGEETQFAGCLMKGKSREEVVHNVEPVFQLLRFEDDLTENVMHTANYIIDCYDPGEWATNITIRLKNGNDIGRELEIINMSGKRLGKLAVCSQPLITDRSWLRDWVAHQFQIGADEVYLHVPKGKQIDDLFGPARDDRLSFNAQLAERNPELTGNQPLKQFIRSSVVWHEYWPNPHAHYYGIFLVFSACAYRLRYAYDYTTHFDIDEFWVAARGSKEQRLPDFLDAHMNKSAASASFVQRMFPIDCPTRTKGDYASRFTLAEAWTGQRKVAIRPKYVESMHVHYFLSTSPEYSADFGDDVDISIKAQEFYTNSSYLKHIRPGKWKDDAGNYHIFPCAFGKETDPDGHHIIIED